MDCLRSVLKARMVVVDRFDIEKVKGYTIMPNYHQRDRSLTVKAKGILSQMFSLPEGWDYTLKGLAYLNADGIETPPIYRFSRQDDMGNDDCRNETNSSPTKRGISSCMSS